MGKKERRTAHLQTNVLMSGSVVDSNDKRPLAAAQREL